MHRSREYDKIDDGMPGRSGTRGAEVEHPRPGTAGDRELMTFGSPLMTDRPRSVLRTAMDRDGMRV